MKSEKLKKKYIAKAEVLVCRLPTFKNNPDDARKAVQIIALALQEEHKDERKK